MPKALTDINYSIDIDGELVFEITRTHPDVWRLTIIDYRDSRPTRDTNNNLRGHRDGIVCWGSQHKEIWGAREWVELIKGDPMYIDEHYIAIKIHVGSLESWER